MADPLIVVGRSTQAAAQSARLAGYDPHIIEVRQPMEAPPRVAAGPAGATVLYTAPIDQAPDVVAAIALDRELIGCPPEALRSLRDPMLLSNLPGAKGLKFPTVRPSVSLAGRLADAVFGSMRRKRFLRKPIPGQGGAGITMWSGGQPGRDAYLQQHIEGTPLTAVFFSDGWSSAMIGVVEKLTERGGFGGGPFETMGYVGPVGLSRESRSAVSHLGVVLAQRHDLRGLFSVDLILDERGALWPIDIDARYPEAADPLERASGSSAIKRSKHTANRGWVCGRLEVRAAAASAVPDLTGVLPAEAMVGAAVAGSQLVEGQPICIVLAQGGDRDGCVEILQQRRAAVEAAISDEG